MLGIVWELDNQGTWMIDQKTIQEVALRLAKAYSPLAICLFGSYAWGSPTEDSDLDIAVIVEKYDKDKYYMLLDGHRALADLRISKDLILYTQEEFDIYSNDEFCLSYTIKKCGKKIYIKA